MDSSTFNLKIWGVAFAEGFSTLAVEVVAIRLAIPVVGSSMTLTGVMLGVVLFALSAGYWRGGELSSRWGNDRTRAVLTRNLLLAGAFYAAVSFPAEAFLLEKVLDAGLNLGLALGVTATALFGLPVYLASQTVPMLAELTNTEGKAGKASGKVLFFSTLGSVAGGIVTPIWLFPYLGVRASTYVVCGLLVCAAGLMAFGQGRPLRTVAFTTAALASVFVSRAVARPEHARYAFDSSQQSIRIVEAPKGMGRIERTMILNGGRASGIYTDTGESSFSYVREADRALSEVRSERVLAIGSAGFTFPRDASAMPFVKQVDAVDVDPVVLRIAEEQFLLQRLPAKIRFFPESARSAVRQFHKEGRRYGFTLLDAYSGKGIPDELLTVEFFSGIRAISDHVAANIIMDGETQSEFARNLLSSFRQAFGQVWLKDVHPGSGMTNCFVTDWNTEGSVAWRGKGRVYRDDQNTADRDHVHMMWSDDE